MFRSPKLYLVATLILIGAAGLMAQIVCQIGNLEEPIGPPIPGIVQGEQVFAYLVHPIEQCNCADGFVQLQEIFMWLEFEPVVVPQNFMVRAGIRRAKYDAALDLWAPDSYFYESNVFPVEVMEPGPFILHAPAFNARWMDIQEYYFLTLAFETPVQANLLGDLNDQPGIAYISPDGDNWFDLYGPEKTSGGKPIIWGDVLCGADDGADAPLPEAKPGLEQPFPNPFNPGTKISLVMEQAGMVKLTIHDSRGHLVKVLAEEHRDKGTWQYEWDGTDARGQGSPAGLYFFRAETAGGVSVRKAALIK